MTNADGKEDKDEEEVALEDAIVRKLTIAIYADALNTYLAQATEVEAKAEWWARAERSKLPVSCFILQSMFFIFAFIVPEDITFFGSVSLTSHECIYVSIYPLPFVPQKSLSKISLRPGALTTTFFPRLENEISLALVVLIPPYTTHGERFVTRILWSYLAFTGRMLTLPLELTHVINARYLWDNWQNFVPILTKLKLPGNINRSYIALSKFFP